MQNLHRDQRGPSTATPWHVQIMLRLYQAWLRIALAPRSQKLQERSKYRSGTCRLDRVNVPWGKECRPSLAPNLRLLQPILAFIAIMPARGLASQSRISERGRCDDFQPNKWFMKFGKNDRKGSTAVNSTVEFEWL